MESNAKPSPSEAHPETMDFLSRTWCNFAVHALQPDLHDQSIVLLDNSIKNFESEAAVPLTVSSSVLQKMEKSTKMDDGDFKCLPPWKSNDLKSWIWMQQAMHPELNYNSCFHRKWVPFKLAPFKGISIKKWLKERKQKRKEEERLQKAEVHAAISVAGVAAALAAIAADNSKKGEPEAVVASAAALVAAQCAQAAAAMGAKKEQLSSVIDSAMSGTSTSDILTLTAAATTSLRGAATLKARTGCKKRLNGSTPILPIEENNNIDEFDKSTTLLAKGADLRVETPDGEYKRRWVSVTQEGAKVILKHKKLSLWKCKKECTILDVHGELYRDSEAESSEETCYLIVLTTNLGTIKLDMVDDYWRYKTWAAAIHHMLMLSTSFTNHQLQLYNN